MLEIIMSEHNAEHDAHASHHHVSSAGLYWSVWIGLMILTVITVLAYYIPLWLDLNLGAGNVIIAMAIATTKATLVCMFFMGLKYDKKFNLIAFLSSLIFLGLFLSFTLLDINTREDSPPFAKPLYTGKEIVGGGHSEGSSSSSSSSSTAPAAAPAAAAAGSPAGEAKPAASQPAGAETAPAAAATTPAAKH